MVAHGIQDAIRQLFHARRSAMGSAMPMDSAMLEVAEQTPSACVLEAINSFPMADSTHVKSGSAINLSGLGDRQQQNIPATFRAHPQGHERVSGRLRHRNLTPRCRQSSRLRRSRDRRVLGQCEAEWRGHGDLPDHVSGARPPGQRALRYTAQAGGQSLARCFPPSAAAQWRPRRVPTTSTLDALV